MEYFIYLKKTTTNMIKTFRALRVILLLLVSNYKVLLIFLLPNMLVLQAQTEAPSWVQFAEKKESNKLGEATLSDYSYSGYRFSEKEIPDVSAWTKFDVTNYGATPNDANYDDDGIRAAIAAASSSGQPAVVYFPAGKYLVADAANASKPIVINKSNIVLKGAGAGAGGTEIYADQYGDFPWRFHFKADNAASDDLITSISKRINRGDFTIEVQSASALSIGQTVELWHQGVENLEANMPGLSYNPVWNTGNRGVRTLEKHIITSIEGNNVTFKNPVQYNITAEISGAELREYYTIEEVGVEDILFTSGWKNSSEIYTHHGSDFVDYAYRALAFENVKNGWIRNCEIRDWNESLMVEKSMGVTVKNILISGKQGHTSYFARYSYGVLFEDCRDIVPVGFKDAGGQGHGPGMRWSTVNTVFKNCEMQKHQPIDCHGYHPYSNLLDNVYGGSFYNSGGAESAYPNSGPYMTFWNFIHASNYSSKQFDFWDPVNRKTHTYAKPIFVGFQSPGENITFKNEGLNELKDVEAYPKSLFDAQLQLRLYGAYMSASSSKAASLPVNANDRNTQTSWISKDSGADEWLILDLGKAEGIYELTINEPVNIIGDWKLEGFKDGVWETLKTGTHIGANKIIAFDEFVSRKFRFIIVNMKAGEESSSVSIQEFKVSGSNSNVGIFDTRRTNAKFVDIYPNPSSDIIHIEINKEGKKDISIYSSTGKLVWQQSTNHNKVQLSKGSKLIKGIYIIVVTSENNSIQTSKFVII
ncbi:DUF4955 domain-containing protein [Labilibacter marinus]|uniref:DUF4955 domain-containing protein n=1 Tax=Labilibacter marinus TaxID=1477105 RepID=UPI0008371FE7|nr:DUF4955 domain-containing protein [Labilibacter marinus]